MTGALNDKEINQTYVKVNPHMFFLDHMHFKTNALLFHLIFCRFWVRCHISVDQVGVITFLSFQGTIFNLGATYSWFFFLFCWSNIYLGDLFLPEKTMLVLSYIVVLELIYSARGQHFWIDPLYLLQRYELFVVLFVCPLVFPRKEKEL